MKKSFGGKDCYTTLALEKIWLNFQFPGVINYGVSEIYVANIVLQKYFLPDPCLIDKARTILGQNVSLKQQKMFKCSAIIWINFILLPGFKNFQTVITQKPLIFRLQSFYEF